MGYIYNILPYTGRETPEVFSSEFSHINMTGQIVTHLDKSHHLFANRYYSGVGLAMELHRRQTGYTGTIMANRVQLLPEVRTLRLTKGAMKAWSGEKMLVIGWKDKQVRPTILVSTVCSSETIRVDRRDPNRPAVGKPDVVHQYNQIMNGVD